MRQIDIDSLSEQELIELNHKVVARLRLLNQMRSHCVRACGHRIRVSQGGIRQKQFVDQPVKKRTSVNEV